METRDVIIQGFLPGSDPQEAKQRLTELIKASPMQIEQICRSFPYSIKKGIDASTAERYKVALEKAGFDCRSDHELTFDLPLPVSSAGASQSLQDADEEASKPKQNTTRTIINGVVALLLIAGVGQAYKYFSSQAPTKQYGPAGTVSIAPFTVQQEQAPSLAEDELRLVQKIRATPSQKEFVSKMRGQEMLPGIEIHYVLDQFGENPSCQIEFQQKDKPNSPANGVRKWTLTYLVSNSGRTEALFSANFFETTQPLRAYFDHRADYVPMSADSSGAAVSAQEWLPALTNSKSLRIVHGQGSNGEISFDYDISQFTKVRRIAYALCGTAAQRQAAKTAAVIPSPNLAGEKQGPLPSFSVASYLESFQGSFSADCSGPSQITIKDENVTFTQSGRSSQMNDPDINVAWYGNSQPPNGFSFAVFGKDSLSGKYVSLLMWDGSKGPEVSVEDDTSPRLTRCSTG